jgi:TBC1 domain family member 10
MPWCRPQQTGVWLATQLSRPEVAPPAVQFQRLVEDELPELGRHLAYEGVAPSMYCSHWFMTAFAYALPFDHLLRVWDVFLLEGIKVLLPVHYLQSRSSL